MRLMNSPIVSVVMSVRNGGNGIRDSINSILEQKDIDLELVLIDDGSTDDTSGLLTAIAKKDPRVRLLKREGRGLTRALIEGCEVAKGEFIARQDAFDYSMPDRLLTQVTYLKDDESASMCSSYVRFVTVEGEIIFKQSSSEAVAIEGLTGIVHGSTMFRKRDYAKVGGYRKHFYYAQDVDLWSRLVEVGKHIIVPKYLYDNCLYPDSISGSRRKEQIKLHTYILNATKARRAGMDDSRWLNKAAIFSEKCRAKSKKKINNSQGAYFIGSCLIDSNPSLAKKYLKFSICSNPLNFRARLKLMGIK